MHMSPEVSWCSVCRHQVLQCVQETAAHHKAPPMCGVHVATRIFLRLFSLFSASAAIRRCNFAGHVDLMNYILSIRFRGVDHQDFNKIQY